MSADYKPRAGFLSIKRSWLHIVSAKKAEKSAAFFARPFCFFPNMCYNPSGD